MNLYRILLLAIIQSIMLTHVNAQQNLLHSESFGFEENSSDWKSSSQNSWSMSNEKAASGSTSLKYISQESTLMTAGALYSIDTKHTIQKVRTAQTNAQTLIIASAYEGTIMALGYDGVILWKNDLSGFMNHDIWCADITNDGNDEILVANANGVIYCLDYNGNELWQFGKNSAPMYAVCAVAKQNTYYVVCGGFDNSVYYLNVQGEEVKELKSSTYSVEKPWGDGIIPEKFVHMSNFLRPLKKADGSEALAILGTNNHMQVDGTVYLFNPLDDLPYSETKVESATVIGDFRMVDANKDGEEEILLGTSGHTKNTSITRFKPELQEMLQFDIEKLDFGYRVVQTELIKDGNEDKLLSFIGNDYRIIPTALEGETEDLLGNYSFNDMWKDKESGRIILASAQSGGSCIHILNTQEDGWKDQLVNLNPKGKIEKIINNTNAYRSALAGFAKPEWERDALPVYLLTEKFDTDLSISISDQIKANYSSPIFFGGEHMPKVEDWDRSAMENEKYRDKRDGRKQYVLSQQEVLDLVVPWYNGVEGIAYWGGHGNDPYMFQLETSKKVFDAANGKKNVLIYPELEDHTEDFAWVMEDLFYPMAEYAQQKNANIFVRCKHTFWQANAHLPMWERMLNGEFADVFVPSMEETTDKSMDLSLAARMGIWASGAVNSWGARSVPDNPSFDRSRQFCHQTLPNHFLRQMVYAISSGAQYINNFAVDQDYMSFLWELIAQGALYVPERNEIVSFSPVHLSMKDPDEYYMNEGSNVKWSSFYNEQAEDENKLVFSHLNGSWPAAPVTEWDFSRYASGVKDRRLHFIPPYPNGMVLITPTQNGVFAADNPARGALADHLHPIYSNILKEYISDGRNYYSPDGLETYAADEYYALIEEDIKQNASKLPLSVSGDVGWVVAQTSPTHLRLTIIDGGYLNPDDRKAIVTFNTVTPIGMSDLVDGKMFDISNPLSVEVDIPCGLFRFIDIELNQALN